VSKFKGAHFEIVPPVNFPGGRNFSPNPIVISPNDDDFDIERFAPTLDLIPKVLGEARRRVNEIAQYPDLPGPRAVHRTGQSGQFLVG